jgi:hypothetical protein
LIVVLGLFFSGGVLPQPALRVAPPPPPPPPPLAPAPPPPPAPLSRPGRHGAAARA